MLALAAVPTACTGAGHTKLAARPAAALRTPGHAVPPRRTLRLPVKAYQSDKEEAAASTTDRSALFHSLAKQVGARTFRVQSRCLVPAHQSGSAGAAAVRT